MSKRRSFSPSAIFGFENTCCKDPRVKAIVGFKSQRGSIFDLASKPKSLAAYKKYIVPLGIAAPLS